MRQYAAAGVHVAHYGIQLEPDKSETNYNADGNEESALADFRAAISRQPG